MTEAINRTENSTRTHHFDPSSFSLRTLFPCNRITHRRMAHARSTEARREADPPEERSRCSRWARLPVRGLI